MNEEDEKSINSDEDEGQEEKEIKDRSILADFEFMKKIHELARKINPINLSYSENIEK